MPYIRFDNRSCLSKSSPVAVTTASIVPSPFSSMIMCPFLSTIRCPFSSIIVSLALIILCPLAGIFVYLTGFAQKV